MLGNRATMDGYTPCTCRLSNLMKKNPEHVSTKCSLCSSGKLQFFFKDKFRNFFKCSTCSLIFVPSEFHVSTESEKARYEEHNNDPNDIRYRGFLERIVPPIKERFEADSRGLDFGCGPTTLLADILREDGFEMEVYDPFYAPDRSALDREYDFIVSTEVVEHLKSPLDEFRKLLSILKPNGILAVMTRLFDGSIDFKTWHYKNDRTHICFYSIETFDWLAKQLRITYGQIEHDIFVFERCEG